MPAAIVMCWLYGTPLRRCQLGIVTLLALARITQHLGKHQDKFPKGGR